MYLYQVIGVESITGYRGDRVPWFCLPGMYCELGGFMIYTTLKPVYRHHTFPYDGGGPASKAGTFLIPTLATFGAYGCEL